MTTLRALLWSALLGLGACVPMPGDPGEPCHARFGCGPDLVCVPDGQDGVCRSVVEVCGQACPGDQTCDPERKSCIATGACTEGETRTCGLCGDGIETCRDGAWSACEGASPAIEIPCDGLDNDCDEQTDEDPCTSAYASSCDDILHLCQNVDDGTCGYVAPGEDSLAARLCLVDGGSFALGEPAQATTIATFLLDRDEVTNARYLAYYLSLDGDPTTQQQALPICTPDHLGKSWTTRSPFHPAGLAQHPVSCVTQAQAAAFCAWAGKRLPTEKEWEAAAAGAGGFTFPWGDSFVPGRANCLDLSCHDIYTSGTCVQGLTTCPDTAPVDQLCSAPDDGRSLAGLAHLAGNVAEWAVADGAVAVVKGGSFDDPSETLRHWERDPRAATSAQPTIGFRCALSPR